MQLNSLNVKLVRLNWHKKKQTPDELERIQGNDEVEIEKKTGKSIN